MTIEYPIRALGPYFCFINGVLNFTRIIIADFVVLWKIQKFDWLIPDTK